MSTATMSVARKARESGTNDHGVIRAVFKYKPIKTEAREIANETA